MTSLDRFFENEQASLLEEFQDEWMDMIQNPSRLDYKHPLYHLHRRNSFSHKTEVRNFILH